MSVVSKLAFGVAVVGAFAAVAVSEVKPDFFGSLVKAVIPQSAAAYGYETPREMRVSPVPTPPSYGYENPRLNRYYVPPVVMPTSTSTRQSR